MSETKQVSFMLDRFLVYEKDPRVKFVILKGIGKAFSAGGDMASVIRDIREGNWRVRAKYFQAGYTLIYVLATARKPQVSILDGIVMGGGAGVSINGQFRVATEKSVFSMPETGLGHFTDVGASYFISRLPGFFGEYAGLTGSRLDGAEMLAIGLATHFVPSERLSSLEEALIEADSSDPSIISAVIYTYAVVPNLKEGSAIHRLKIINSCFSRKTVEEIISALEKEAVGNEDEWISSTIQLLRKASPTSLKISLRLIREGRFEGVGECIVKDYKMLYHVIKGDISKDFFEGCRAILLDKDKNPKWNPATLEEVSDEMVDKYFSKVEDEDWEDLKVPPTSNLPAFAIGKL